MITDNFSKFASFVISNVPFDLSSYQMDHFGYQTSSAQDYELLRNSCSTIGTLVSENIVNGRRVGIFKFLAPFIWENYEIEGFELVEPKPDQVCPSELDHIEFVIPEDFSSFIEKHNNIDWDLIAMNRPEFPKISIKLDDGKSIKFHTKDIFSEIPK